MNEITKKMEELKDLDFRNLETHYEWNKILNAELRKVIREVQNEKQLLVKETANTEVILKMAESTAELELLDDQLKNIVHQDLNTASNHFLHVIKQEEIEEVTFEEKSQSAMAMSLSGMVKGSNHNSVLDLNKIPNVDHQFPFLEDIPEDQKKIDDLIDFVKNCNLIEPIDDKFAFNNENILTQNNSLHNSQISTNQKCRFKFSEEFKQNILEEYKIKFVNKERYKILETKLMNLIFEFSVLGNEIVDILSNGQSLKDRKMGKYVRQFIHKRMPVNESYQIRQFAQKVKEFVNKMDI